MDSLLVRLQKYNYYILIPIVILFSFSLAYLLMTLLRMKFRPPPKKMSNITAYNSSQSGLPPKPSALYEEMVSGNLIRSRIIEEQEEKGEDAKGERDMETAAIQTEDPEADQMLVTGTLSGHRSFARVTIRDQEGGKEAEEYKTYDKIGGYKIVSIRQHSILVSRGKFKFPVKIEETFGEARERVAEKIAARQEKEGKPEDLESSSTIKKVISRVDVESKLRNQEELYKNARFGPNYDGKGKMDGYKIIKVGPSHIFHQLGARNGDIVKRINGTPIDSTKRGMEIMATIETAPKVTVDIDRNGKIITYEFTIKN